MLLFILLISFILRIIKIDQSFWLDEGISALAVKDYSFNLLFTRFALGDFHPPLYYLLLKLWTEIFGTNELALRFPSVVFGVAAVWLVYLIGEELFNKKTALLAGFLMASAPLHIYYSQEARMYSLVTFLSLASFYFLIKLQMGKLYILGYLISSAMILYTDYPAYFLLLVQGVYVFLFKKQLRKIFLILTFISSILFIPWFFNLYQQFQSAFLTLNNLPVLAGVLGEANIKNLLLVFAKFAIGRISFENQLNYYFYTVIIFLIYSIPLSLSLRKLGKEKILLLLWILIPLISLFTISYLIPLFSYFRVLFILPAFILLVSSGIDILKDKYQVGLISILILINLSSLIIFYATPKFQRENWKLATKTIQNISLKKEGVILFESNSLFAPFRYYSQDNSNVVPALIKLPARSLADIIEIKKLNGKAVYLFEYLVDITDPNRFVEQKLTSSGYTKIDTYNFEGVGFVHVYNAKINK